MHCSEIRGNGIHTSETSWDCRSAQQGGDSAISTNAYWRVSTGLAY
jgi:hypothetical protein